jgi:Domain of unknown function (DUF4148)
MKIDTMIKTASVLVLGAGLLLGAVQRAAAADDGQSTGQLTRAEVRHQLADLQSVGYDWASNDNHYPEDLQAAEQRLAARNGERQASASTSNTR